MSIYYAAITGSDANPGTLSQPYRTLAKGVQSLQAGDTLYIRGGTYVERLHSSRGIVWPNGTSWTNAITIAAYQGESVTLRPPLVSGGFQGAVAFDRPEQATHYLIFDGLIIDAINTEGESAVGISEGANHIRFQNCEIKNSWQNGVIISWGPSGHTSDYNEFINCTLHHSGRDGGSQDPVTLVNVPGPDTQPGLGRGHGFYISTSHNLVRNCVIYSNGEYGLKFYNGSIGLTSNFNTIRESVLHNNGQNTTRLGHPTGGGILLSTGTNNQAINNVVYSHSDVYLQGIAVGFTQPVSNSMIYNNTVYDSGDGFLVTSHSTNAIFKNNIVHTASTGIHNIGSGTILDHTMMYQVTTQILNTGTITSTNTTIANPLFVSTSLKDFSLQVGSPAIDAGVNLSPDVTNDYLGVSRPKGAAYDLGAYESTIGLDITPPAVPTGLQVT